MNKEIARKLIESGVHFGHAVSRWNPKMQPYIFGKRGMIHIINVKETLKGLIIAKKLLADVVSSGKDVVFVGTKRQAHKGVLNASEKSGMHWVTERWLGGTLTNFRTIRSRLKRLEELEQMVAEGKMDAESKKQAARLKREMKKIKTNLEGIRKMNRMPGAVVVVDTRNEYIALREASKLEIPTIGVIDTDSDPDIVDVAIPANDDSIKAINIILNELAEAVNEGKTQVSQFATQAQQGLTPPGVKKRSRRRALASAVDEDGEPETSAPPAPKARESQKPAPVEAKETPEPAAQEPAAEQNEQAENTEPQQQQS